MLKFLFEEKIIQHLGNGTEINYKTIYGQNPQFAIWGVEHGDLDNFGFVNTSSLDGDRLLNSDDWPDSEIIFVSYNQIDDEKQYVVIDMIKGDLERYPGDLKIKNEVEDYYQDNVFYLIDVD